MSLKARLLGFYEDVARDFNHTHNPLPASPPPVNRQTHPAERVPAAAPPNAGPWPLTPALNSVSVTLDGNGNGTAQLGPQYVKEHFQVQSASVAVAPLAGQTAPLKQATCSIYVGSSVNSATFYGTTYTGSIGDTCSIGTDIQTGQLVIAVWAGGDVGAIATMSLNGQRTIGAPTGT